MRNLTDYEVEKLGDSYSTLGNVDWDQARVLYSDEYHKVTKVFVEPDMVLGIYDNDKFNEYHELMEEDVKEWVTIVLRDLEIINGGQHYDEIKEILLMVAKNGY